MHKSSQPEDTTNIIPIFREKTQNMAIGKYQQRKILQKMEDRLRICYSVIITILGKMADHRYSTTHDNDDLRAKLFSNKAKKGSRKMSSLGREQFQRNGGFMHRGKDERLC